MQVPRLSFGLYIHHSCIPVRSNGKDVSLRRYKPVCRSTGYQENLTLSLGNLPKKFKAEWFTPDQDAPICSQLVDWPGFGGAPVTSPQYAYDLALRVTPCTVGQDCPPATTNCSTAQALTCPLIAYPDDGECP